MPVGLLSKPAPGTLPLHGVALFHILKFYFVFSWRNKTGQVRKARTVRPVVPPPHGREVSGMRRNSPLHSPSLLLFAQVFSFVSFCASGELKQCCVIPLSYVPFIERVLLNTWSPPVLHTPHTHIR